MAPPGRETDALLRVQSSSYSARTPSIVEDGDQSLETEVQPPPDQIAVYEYWKCPQQRFKLSRVKMEEAVDPKSVANTHKIHGKPSVKCGHGHAALSENTASLLKLFRNYDSSWWAIYEKIGGTQPCTAMWFRKRKVGVLLDSLLRGVSQLSFQNHTWCGLLMLIQMSIGTPLATAYGVIAALWATLTCLALGVSVDRIQFGLFQMNALCFGMVYGLGESSMYPGVFYAIGGATGTVVLQLAFGTFFQQTFRTLPFSLPYVLATWVFIFYTREYGLLEYRGSQPTFLHSLPANVTAPPREVIIGKYPSALVWAECLGSMLANVLFQTEWYHGVLFIVFTALASPISSMFALVGALSALGVGMVDRIPPEDLAPMGLSAISTAQAVGFFYVPELRSVILAVVVSVFATVLNGALRSALRGPLGVSPLGLPFIISMQLILLIQGNLNLLPVSLEEMTVPESHLRLYHISLRTLRKMERLAATTTANVLTSPGSGTPDTSGCVTPHGSPGVNGEGALCSFTHEPPLTPTSPSVDGPSSVLKEEPLMKKLGKIPPEVTRAVFDELDYGGKGMITVNDIICTLRTFGFAWSCHLDSYVARYAVGTDDLLLSYRSFHLLINDLTSTYIQQDEMLTVFRLWDVDRTGVITKDNITSICQALSVDCSNILKAFDVIDYNEDGVLSYQEFVEIFLRSKPVRPSEATTPLAALNNVRLSMKNLRFLST